MTIRTLDCDVRIGGVDFSSHVVAINREHFMCRPIGMAEIYLDADNAPACTVGSAVTIEEMGKRQFTGYVSETEKSHPPAQYIVICQDELKRLLEYQFVDTEIVSSGETVSYWIEYFLQRVGVQSYSVAETTYPVPSGIIFHLENVLEIVRKLCATQGWQVYADEFGTVRVGDFTDIGLPSFVNTYDRAASIRDDAWLRNKIVVFGAGTIQGVQTPSIRQLPDETWAVVLASPHIDTQAEADIAAEGMVKYFETPLQTKEVQIEDSSTPVKLFDTLAAGDAFVGGFMGLVTGVESEFTREGYRVTAFLDERCPQFWGFWEIEQLGDIWLSTKESGVYRYVYWDDIWIAVNHDLSGEALVVREVAADPNDSEIAWIASVDGLYKWELGTWAKESLPVPDNDAGDSPAPGLSDLEFTGIEITSGSCIFATARHRTMSRGWLYEYDGSSWSNDQLQYGASYAVRPLPGPQALHVPTENAIYLTAETATTRLLMRRISGSWATPYTTSGSPFEVTGPKLTASPIYMFGNPSPILLSSYDYGSSQTDIKHAAGDPVRPVLPAGFGADDDIIVATSSGSVLQRILDLWENRGTRPIVPASGFRSYYSGSQVLLGQNAPGQPSIVSYSPDEGRNWSDLSTGLPDVQITSISSRVGPGGGWAPQTQICPDLEFFLGRYWWSRYCRHSWPWMWDYISGEYTEDTCFWWRTEIVDPTPHLGIMITHIMVENCQEHPTEDGITFDLVFYVYSPKGSLTSNQRMMHHQATSRASAEDPQYYGDINNDGQYGSWQTQSYSVTKLSGTWLNGWYKVVFKPFGDLWEPKCLYRSSPWMAFNYVHKTGDVMPFRRAYPGEDLWPDCNYYECGDPFTQVDNIIFGERSYPFNYLTLRDEFEARFPLFYLGPYMGYCIGTGSDPFTSHVWLGQDEGLGAFVPWYRYEMYDFGLGLLHIVGE